MYLDEEVIKLYMFPGYFHLRNSIKLLDEAANMHTSFEIRKNV